MQPATLSSLTSACTCFQIHSYSQSPHSQATLGDLICCICGYRCEFPSSSLLTQPLVLCFGFGPTSTCKLPSGVCSPKTRAGDSSSLLGLTCSVGKESACNSGDPGSIPGLGRFLGEGKGYPLQYSWASLVAQLVKNLPAVWETWVRSLGWEGSLEKGKATHSGILA